MASGVELATAYIQLIPSLRGAQREIQRQMGPLGSKAGHEFGEDFSDASGAEVEKSGGGVKGAIGKAGSFGADFGKKFGLAAAAGIGLTVGASIKAAIDQEAETDRVAAALGANPREAARLGRLAGQIYGQNFGESVGDVASALEAVSSSFQKIGTGKELKTVTEQALNFTDIFQVDLPRAVSVAQTVVKSGLAKNATEALDLLTAASQRVPAALREDILDASNEYGQFFKQVGFSGPEAFQSLVDNAKLGEFGIDKAGDAIKEFTIRSTDGSKASVAAYDTIGLNAGKLSNDLLRGGDKAGQATQKIVNGLLAIKDPTKQASNAIALFGTPLEDLGVKNIPTFLKSLQSGRKELEGFEGAIDRAGVTANDNASRNIEAFKRQVTQTFVNLIGKKALPFIKNFAAVLSERLGPVVKRIREGLAKLNPLVEKIGDFLNRNAEYVKTFAVVLGVLAGAFLALTLVTAAFSIVLNSTGIPLIIIGIALLVAGLVIAYKRSESFRNIVDKVGASVKQFGQFLLTTVLPAVQKLASDVGAKLKPIFDQLSQTFQARVLPTLQQLFNKIKQAMPAIQQIIGFLARWIGTLIRLAATILGKVLPPLIRFVGFVLSKAVPVIASIIGVVIKVIGKIAAFGTAFLNAANNARQFATKIATVASSVVTKIQDTIGKIPEKIRSYIKGMVNAGKDFIGGLFDGILSAANNAGGFVGSLISSIKNAINDALNLPLTIDFDKGFVHIHATLIPAFAGGTDYAPGGISLVGEEGPELVNLKRGSSVKTAAETRAILSGAQGQAASGGGRAALTITNWQDGTGYFEYLADGRVQSASDMYAERSRATWSR